MKNLPSITLLGICCSVAIYLFLLPTKTGELKELKTKETPPPIDLPASNPDPNYQWASSSSRYEIRIQNDSTDERLEMAGTLEEALAYLKRYAMHHEDLFVYDLKTDAQVASSANGSGVIYTGTNDSYEVREVDHRYEVRIGFSDYTYSNGTWKDTIFTSLSLKESEKYLNEHKTTYTDLIIYDLKADEQVASSTNG